MGRESDFWQWFKKGTDHVQGLHMRRVENMVENGTPDVDACFRGTCFKLELKHSTPTLKGLVRVKYQPLQIPWLEKRRSCGGLAFVFLKTGSGRGSEYFLIDGLDAAKIQKTSLEELRKLNVLGSSKMKAEEIIYKIELLTIL